MDIFVIKNLSSKEIDESIDEMAKRIEKSQIVMIPGGFSGGDSRTVLESLLLPHLEIRVKEAVMKLLNQRRTYAGNMQRISGID